MHLKLKLASRLAVILTLSLLLQSQHGQHDPRDQPTEIYQPTDGPRDQSTVIYNAESAPTFVKRVTPDSKDEVSFKRDGVEYVIVLDEPLGAGQFGAVFKGEILTKKERETFDPRENPQNRKYMAVKFYTRESDQQLKDLDLLLNRDDYKTARHLLTYDPPEIGTFGEEQTIVFTVSQIVYPLSAHNGFPAIKLLNAEQRKQHLALVNRVAKEGVETLIELAKLGIAHRDIKPPNMAMTVPLEQFIAGEGHLVFLDLDFHRLLNRKQTTWLIGTPDYTAPDVVKLEVSTLALGDAYSFGATLFELLTGKSIITNCEERRKVRARGEKLAPLTYNLLAVNPELTQELYQDAKTELLEVEKRYSDTERVGLKKVMDIITTLANPDSVAQLKAIQSSHIPALAEYGKNLSSLPSLNTNQCSVGMVAKLSTMYRVRTWLQGVGRMMMGR